MNTPSPAPKNTQGYDVAIDAAAEIVSNSARPVLAHALIHRQPNGVMRHTSLCQYQRPVGDIGPDERLGCRRIYRHWEAVVGREGHTGSM